MGRSAKAADRGGQLRKCIVTREVLPVDELIRFVASPDGEVVADLKRNLPGRGVWVTARAELVRQAAAGKLFAKAFRQEVRADAELADRIDGLLDESALKALAMARKAGQLVTGFGKVDATIRAGECLVVIHAREAAADGIRKLDQAIHAARKQGAEEVAVKQLWRSQQMDLALGGHNVIHAAAIHGGAGRALLAHIGALEHYRS